MSLHKLAEVTITAYGLPEYTGTDNELQQLADEAQLLIESIDYKELLTQTRTYGFPNLVNKVEIEVKGLD